MQKKNVLFAGIALCLMLGAWGFYWYQKPRQSLSNVRPDYIISAEKLYAAFQNNEQQANQQYLGKIIQVAGKIDNIQQTDSTLSILLSSGNMGGINCSIAKTKSQVQKLPSRESGIQIKGRCVGFLMDVNLVDAVITKP